MSNDTEQHVELAFARVAEHYTRRIVELEKERLDWQKEAVKCGKDRNEALDRAKKAETALQQAEQFRDTLIDARESVLDELRTARARIAELERDVDHWREARKSALDAGDIMKSSLDAANKRIADLDAAVALLRGGCAVEYGSLRELADEMKRARAKFPEQHRLLAALMEEVGETAQAYLEGKPEHAREEALQVACVAMRIYEHGDWDYEPPKGALDRVKDAEAALEKARERILELEAEVAMHESFDGVTVLDGDANVVAAGSVDACPHADGTREWAIWWMDRGKVVGHREGAPWRRVDGECEVFDCFKWIKRYDAINDSLWTIGNPERRTGWRVLTDAEVAALEAAQ